MPNRWIRETARTSKNLNAVSDFGERLFWRMITTADDFGRFLSSPLLVRAACFPLSETLEGETVERALQELVKHDLICLYEVRDRRYGHFIKWFDHQGEPRAKNSKYPDPTCLHLQTSAKSCTHLRTNVTGGPETETETETDVSLHSSLNLSSEIKSSNPPNGFENFWQAYPKKKAKGYAEKAWAKLKPSEQLRQQILTALEQAKTSAEWIKDGGQFIPHPASWLSGKGWEDKPVEKPPGKYDDF